MTLSEVLYEAACRCCRARHSKYTYSCNAIGYVVAHDSVYIDCPEVDAYNAMMSNDCGHLRPSMPIAAAAEVGWPVQEFRTFMLLMAAEATNETT